MRHQKKADNKARRATSKRKPKVSVCIPTYNHESYIAQALDSVLKQRTNFDYEILVGEDDSFDRTREIVKQYHEQYLDKINLFLNDRANVIYLGGHPTGRWNIANLLKHARGDYIALLVGDDYWVSPDKLQNQVDFLEANPDYNISFHNAQVEFDDPHKKGMLYSDFSWNEIERERDTYTIADLIASPLCPTASVVFRRPKDFVLPDWYYKVPSGDMALLMLVCGDGKIKYFDENWAVYRKHAGGITRHHKGDYIHAGRVYMYLRILEHYDGQYVDDIKKVILSHLDHLTGLSSLTDDDQRRLCSLIPGYFDNNDKVLEINRSDPLKITFVAHGPNQLNGPNIWLQRVLPELSKRGFKPQVIFFMNSNDRCDVVNNLRQQGISCITLPRQAFTEQSIVQLLKVVKADPPDVFVPNLSVPAYFAARWVKEAGIPTIGILHSDDSFHHELIENFVAGPEDYRLTGIVCVSEFIEKLVRATGISEVEVLKCSYGIPLPAETARDPGEKLNLVYTGRLIQRQKRIFDVISALKNVVTTIPGTYATLYGEDREGGQVIKTINACQLDDRLRYGGRLSFEEIFPALLQHHGFVLLSDYEGMSISLMEAMAAGLVPICTKTRSGALEIIKHDKNGLLVENREDAFLDAVSRLKHEKGLWQRLSKAARETIEKEYTLEGCIDKWVNFIDNLISKAPARGNINIPEISSINLPPVKTSADGMAREDKRMPRRPVAPPHTNASDKFLNPSLTPDNLDLYYVRASIKKAIDHNLHHFKGILLDVGCGEMPYREYLITNSKISNYIGLDIENPIYQQRIRPDMFWDGKQIDLPDNFVDCALATEFLEHVPDPSAVLREIRRVLKPEGFFFLTVPFLWPLHDPPHDEYRYTPYALERLLKQAGFSEINLKALGGWDASLAQMIGLWLKRRPMPAAERTKFSQILYPLYQGLIEQDELPLKFHSEMITGLSGTAIKPTVVPVQHVERAPSKKKIVMAPGAFPKLSATFILDQIIGLIDRGFEVELWPSYNPQENVIHPDVGRYDLLNKTRYLRFPPDTLRHTPALWVEQFCRWNQVTPADLAGIDVFHIQFGENFNRLAPLFQTLDTRVVVSFHGYDASKYVREHGEHCYIDLFEWANLITTPSHRMKEMLVQYGCPAHKIMVHRYGIDLNKFGPSQPTVADSELTLLTVGRLVEKKGIEDALRAFAQLPNRSNLCYRIVGDGELRSHLEALVAQLGIQDQVIFVGPCTKAQVVEEMAQADIFILTSFTATNGDQEGLPVALIEAQASGLPVISTHHAGIPELVQHGQTGFLAPERDVTAIADYLQRLVADPNLRRIMATNARQRVETEFNIDALNNQLAYYLAGGRLANEDAGQIIASQTAAISVIRQPAAGQNSRQAVVNSIEPMVRIVDDGCRRSAEQGGQSENAPEPTISIVIPTYNRAHFISDALTNALAQTVPATEIVVVDDGSTDDTADIVAKLGGPRVRYVKKEHSGGPATRNRCIQEAQGDYLLWLDSDDVLLPDAVTHHLDAWRQAPDADVFYGDAIFTDEQLQPTQLERYQEWYHQNQLLIAQMFLGNCIPNNGTMVRKACYDWVGGYSEVFPRAHDFEMWFRLLDRAIFKYVGNTVVYRRIHSGPALSGTVKNVDLRYEVTIAYGLLERYSLRQLTPYIAWDRQPMEESLAAATMRVALKLIQLDDYHGALAYARQSQAYQDTAQVQELIDKLTALFDSGQAPPVERVPLDIPSHFHVEHGNVAGTLQSAEGRATKAPAPSPDTPASDIRVTAIIAAYNEGDIIYHSIRDLVEQGIEVYFIDHHSTDNTLAEVKKWLGRGVIGIETFPEESGFDVPNDVYTWRFMLQRKEQLVREMGPGWYIHFDADEFRESPWLGVSLKQGIARVEAEGYNAINFKMIDFKPTDDNFQPGQDVRDCLRYYDPNIHPANKLKINCWKYDGQAFNLWQSGGHSVEFAGRKIYPTLFLMRHYPIRSQAHGKRKVFEDRKKRFDKDEKKAQWHAQYDDIADHNHCFIEDKANLILFDRARLCYELSGEVQADNSKSGPSLNGKQPQLAQSAAGVDTTAKPPAQYYEFPRPEVQAMVSPNAKRILDVGCAAGRMAFELKQKLDAEVWGIEVVPQVARLAEQRLDRVIIGGIEMALAELPDGYFDTIIFADVLEHLVDPYAVIETLKTKLTPYGEIVASIPNIRHWSILKDLLEGRWDYQEAGLLDRTHLRFFTRKSVIELFERAGFHLEQMGHTYIEGYGVPPEVLQALAFTDLDLSTLQDEGQHYQYLVRAKLEPQVTALTSIIILTHNQLQHTKLCLESIAVHTSQPHELIMVDNGSTDGTLDYLRAYAEENPQIRIIANAENRGFAAGNNQGLASAKGDYVLLLNNDTIVTAGWLPRLLAVMAQYPEIGLVGPMSNHVSGPQHVPNAIYTDLKGLREFARRWAAEHTGQSIEFLRLVGFCLLVRREVIEHIGGLDEQFGSGNFEDDDFCIRAALAGFKARIAQDVFIHHTGNQTFKGAGIDYHQSMQRNWELFKAKWDIPSEIPVEAGYQLSLEAFSSKQYFIPLPAQTNNGLSKTTETSSANTLILFAHEKTQTQSLTQCLKTLERYHSPDKKLAVKVVNPPADLSLTSRQFNLHKAIENTPTTTLHAALHYGEPYIVLLAADVTITKDWLDHLIAIADSDPTIAAIGPTSNAAPTPQKIKKGYRSLKKDLQSYAAKRAKKYGHAWEEVDYLGGFCLLLKSHQVRVVGGLDDSLPLSVALWDLYQRLQHYGFKLVCAQGVYVHHRQLTEQEGATYDDFVSTQQAAANMFTAGEQVLEQGDFDSAIETFTQMTKQFPDLVAGYTALGSTLLVLDRSQEAIPCLRQAASLAPQISALHNQLGIALYRAGQESEAETAFQEASRLDPANIESLLNLIDLYRAWEDYSAATEMLKIALSLTPDHPDVLVAFGILSLELGDVDGAQQALQHLHEARPDHPDIIALQQALGNCQPPDGQMMATIESRQPNPSIGLEEIRSQVEMAQTQENWSRAIELLQETFKQEVGPEDEAYLWNSLGFCYVKANLPAEAEISFKQGLETMPNHLDLLSNLADLYLQQERYDQATEYLNRALTVDPDDTNILLSLGQCCIQLSVFDTALLAFRRVQALAPETERIDQVVAELEALVLVPV